MEPLNRTVIGSCHAVSAGFISATAVLNNQKKKCQRPSNVPERNVQNLKGKPFVQSTFAKHFHFNSRLTSLGLLLLNLRAQLSSQEISNVKLCPSCFPRSYRSVRGHGARWMFSSKAIYIYHLSGAVPCVGTPVRSYVRD